MKNLDLERDGESEFMLNGFINESHWSVIEEVFPGIRVYYENLQKKPGTFLELAIQFIKSFS